MKYLVAAKKIIYRATDAPIVKHYFTGKWVPRVPETNLGKVPVISVRLSSAKAFDTFDEASEQADKIIHVTGRPYKIYGITNKKLFEARLKGSVK